MSALGAHMLTTRTGNEDGVARQPPQASSAARVSARAHSLVPDRGVSEPVTCQPPRPQGTRSNPLISGSDHLLPSASVRPLRRAGSRAAVSSVPASRSGSAGDVIVEAPGRLKVYLARARPVARVRGHCRSTQCSAAGRPQACRSRAQSSGTSPQTHGGERRGRDIETTSVGAVKTC